MLSRSFRDQSARFMCMTHDDNRRRSVFVRK